jgi:hyperosmotically inducible periplasmic protein
MRRIAGRLLLTSLLACGLTATIACGGGGGGAAARPVATTLDDATITTRVKTALLNDPAVGAQKIDVNAANGVVTLSGVVKTDAEMTRAVELAKSVRGVTDVKSTLHVQP